MGLTASARSSMIVIARSYFEDVQLRKENDDAIGLNVPLTWNAVSPGDLVTFTTNSATVDPIIFVVPKDVVPDKFAMGKQETFWTPYARVNLKTPLPSYSEGDGLYYIRKIELTTSEV